jgi:hypothetical protein
MHGFNLAGGRRFPRVRPDQAMKRMRRIVRVLILWGWNHQLIRPIRSIRRIRRTWDPDARDLDAGPLT